jgi:hypothetical protein
LKKANCCPHPPTPSPKGEGEFPLSSSRGEYRGEDIISILSIFPVNGTHSKTIHLLLKSYSTNATSLELFL